MDILAAIKSDHEVMEELFLRFEKMKEDHETNTSELLQLYNQLCHLLAGHMLAEEEILYPPLRENSITRAEVLEAVEEHHLVRILIKEIQDIGMSERWVAKMTVFQEHVQHHNEEEEEELFEPARNLLSKKELEKMGEQFLQLKNTTAS